jgi:hypothetical protein
LQLTTDQNRANSVVVTYNPGDGSLHADGNGVHFTTFEFLSAGSKFIPAGIPAGTIAPPFDVGTAAKIFKLSAGAGLPSLDLGHSYPTGLTADALLADLTLNGSIAPSGSLESAAGGGPWLYVVPEPSSIALICCGLLGLVGVARKRA